MPHASAGKTHHCVGATNPIKVSPTYQIPQGGCRWTVNPKYCRIHQLYCEKHNWIYLQNQTCVICDGEAAKKARDKKKKEDDDEEKKKATPKRIKKVQKGGKKTPSPKTTEKTIRKTTKTTGAKKNASEKVITFGDWLSSYISGSKKINLKKLKSGVEMNFTDGSSTVTLAPFQVLQTVAPHLFTTEDQTALTRAGNYPPIDGAGGCTIC